MLKHVKASVFVKEYGIRAGLDKSHQHRGDTVALAFDVLHSIGRKARLRVTGSELWAWFKKMLWLMPAAIFFAAANGPKALQRKS